MSDYQTDLLRVLIWMVGGLGAALAYGAWFVIGRYEEGQRKSSAAINGRLDSQDKKLEQIKIALDEDTRALRDMVHGVDVRVTRIESICQVQHNIKPNNIHNG